MCKRTSVYPGWLHKHVHTCMLTALCLYCIVVESELPDFFNVHLMHSVRLNQRGMKCYTYFNYNVMPDMQQGVDPRRGEMG